MDAFPSAGLDVPSAPLAALTLFVAVHKDDIAACVNSGQLARRVLGNKPYIGFRESEADAMERASMVFSDPAVNKDTHALLKLSLSAEALAHFTVTSAGVAYQFAPMLHKQTYPGDTDWKVWHFCGDFPLCHFGVRAQWQEIM